MHRTTQLTNLVGRFYGIRTQSGQTKINDELTAYNLSPNWEECGPCSVWASHTLTFALQLRNKHGKTITQGLHYYIAWQVENKKKELLPVENVPGAIFAVKDAVILRFRCFHKKRKIAVYSLTL
jgi:hypothetical protein